MKLETLLIVWALLLAAVLSGVHERRAPGALVAEGAAPAESAWVVARGRGPLEGGLAALLLLLPVQLMHGPRGGGA